VSAGFAAPKSETAEKQGTALNRFMVGVLTLAIGFVVASIQGRVSAKDNAKPPSMNFEWRTEGPAESCGQDCRIWISATGVITEHTARDFEAFAKLHDVRGATLVLDSEVDPL